ncbi:leucine rich repeat gene family [Adoxophyes honmai entomopoxvirus 'L']|uniref:Leucine rich repeat gene family n=1 Tax=Adoxophyes honmai entomopoxvirus 'L' TaxID=1293540 RepID=A0A916KP03_9POXV|nr:leucine rich repeat gene family [Adoxophyes honmai entomopoxvirus 'L']CCU55342.1 leucine rich repeat gene family [Adoxophyes honmai entomopoxvirus 'L']
MYLKSILLYSNNEEILKYGILDTLYITKNDIIDLYLLKNLINLKELHILYNHKNILNYIPNNITILHISNLNIINFNFLSKLNYLSELNIFNNKNSNISDIFLPKSLTYLNCASCDIENYSFISKLNNLKTLIISNNISIDNDFDNNIPENVETLIMEFMYLKNYKFIERLENLKRLNISFNHIKNNLHLINLTSNLQYLDDYGTYIENYNFLKKLPNLIEYRFDLDKNINISNVNLSSQYNLTYLDLYSCVLNVDLLLGHTKLKKIKLNFRSCSNDIIIDLPVCLENIKIINNHNINNYNFIKELINLKKMKIVNSCINNLYMHKNLETIKFENCNSNYAFSFKYFNKLYKLTTLKLGIINPFINDCILPNNIQKIIIGDMSMLKNIKYIESIKNLQCIEINNIYFNTHIKNDNIINLNNTNIKYFKLINCPNVKFIIYLPDTIEIIEYIHKLFDISLWKYYTNLKKIIILKCIKDRVMDIYKNKNVEICFFEK